MLNFKLITASALFTVLISPYRGEADRFRELRTGPVYTNPPAPNLELGELESRRVEGMNVRVLSYVEGGADGSKGMKEPVDLSI